VHQILLRGRAGAGDDRQPLAIAAPGARRGHLERHLVGEPDGGERVVWQCRSERRVRRGRQAQSAGRRRCRDTDPLAPSKRMRVDPVLAGELILAPFSAIFGFFVFLGMATWLPR